MLCAWWFCYIYMYTNKSTKVTDMHMHAPPPVGTTLCPTPHRQHLSSSSRIVRVNSMYNTCCYSTQTHTHTHTYIVTRQRNDEVKERERERMRACISVPLMYQSKRNVSEWMCVHTYICMFACTYVCIYVCCVANQLNCWKESPIVVDSV